MLKETSEHFLHKDNVTTEEVRSRIQDVVGVHDDLLIMVRTWKLSQMV